MPMTSNLNIRHACRNEYEELKSYECVEYRRLYGIPRREFDLSNYVSVDVLKV